MSNLSPVRGQQQPGLPTPPQGDVVAQYRTYLEAQKAVDYLSDNHFPVRAVTIVGVGLQMVERVTGRLTYSRVALAGLASGAWFGLFVGLLISLFGNAEGFSVFAAVFIGAAFGLLFGLISYALTGGRRDFTSTSQIVAGEYQIRCLTEQAGQAMQLLNRLAGEGGPRSAPAAPTTPSGPSGPSGPSAPTVAQPVDRPAEEPAAPEEAPKPAEPVTGPTYGEMIDRKRREESGE
jgi:heat induced stress protein YflT